MVLGVQTTGYSVPVVIAVAMRPLIHSGIAGGLVLSNSVFKASLGLLVLAATCLGSTISLVSGYAGSDFFPVSGYAISYSLPYSNSYSTSEAIVAPGYSGTYSVAASASGTLTTATLSASTSYSGAPGTIPYSNFKFISANSFSGANLMVNGPVYLSESVTVNYSFPSISNSPGFTETLGFYDSKGNLIGSSCTLPTSTPTVQGTVSCSTGLVLVDSSSAISVGNSLEAGLAAFSPGDSASFQGTATLGLLDVYDANGNFIEAVNLNSLSSAAPEPATLVLSIAGMIGLVAAAKVLRAEV